MLPLKADYKQSTQVLLRTLSSWKFEPPSSRYEDKISITPFVKYVTESEAIAIVNSESDANLQNLCYRYRTIYRKSEQCTPFWCTLFILIAVNIRLCVLYLFNDCLECGGVVEGEVSENLTVDFDT